MNFQDVYKKIAEDISYLFTNMANTLKYDKTFRAKVISQESTGKYKILYKNVEYTAKCDGRLNAGDLVWVCAPRNDWNELYVQLGGAIQNQVNQINGNLNNKADKDVVIIRDQSFADTTVPANGSVDIPYTPLAVTGYTPLAYIPKAAGNSNAGITALTATLVRLRNFTSSSQVANPTIAVLYIKN
ncbi:hypothetical protein [Lacrimispora brassicae]